jgi:hypothetical protein
VDKTHDAILAGLLPPAAERFVELHQALIYVVARLRQCEFRLK